MAHRLLSGSLDRAVDVAATLELRGYAQSTGGAKFRKVPSRYDTRFWLVGSILAVAAVTSIVFGVGELVTYPELEYSLSPLSVSLAGLYLVAGFTTWRRGGRRDVKGR